MNAKNLAFIFCAIIICGCVRRSRCKNVTITTSEASPISVELITELFLMIIGLIEQFDRGVIPHYSRFFDAGLLRKARDVFRYSYGYARNETQGIEWEASAVAFFQQYVIHASATQANAHYEYYAEFIDKKIGEPCSLRMICLTRIRQQIKLHLKNDSYIFNANDYVLRYLLMGFMELPVFVTTTESSPFLVIQLNKNYNSERFIDDEEVLFNTVVVAQQNRTKKIYKYPLPFLGVENFVNEMAIFWRAQSNVFDLLSDCPSNWVMSSFVDAAIDAHISHFFEEYFSNRTNSIMETCCVRRSVVILYFIIFLEDEYRRLICHPFYETNWTNETTKRVMGRRQMHLRRFYKIFVTVGCTKDCSTNACRLLKSLYDSLRRIQPIVGYSLRRPTGIAIVKNRRAR